MRNLSSTQKKKPPVWKDLVTYLVGFEALDSLLLLLLSEDDEGSTVFVECKTHFVYSRYSEGTGMLSIESVRARIASSSQAASHCLCMCVCNRLFFKLTSVLKGGI